MAGGCVVKDPCPCGSPVDFKVTLFGILFILFSVLNVILNLAKVVKLDIGYISLDVITILTGIAMILATQRYFLTEIDAMKHFTCFHVNFQGILLLRLRRDDGRYTPGVGDHRIGRDLVCFVSIGASTDVKVRHQT